MATKVAIEATATGSPGPEVDIWAYVDGIGAVLAGTANVIMQLGWPPVGYGVLESKVESGQITRHPIKRSRTTFTYIAVAMLGTDEERRLYREAVNRSHAQVRSTTASPVAYNAFDPELQLWVAACLYWGSVDLYTRLRGPMDDQTADKFYEYGARFGTTLQLKPEMWPADRAAFERYWNASMEKVSIEPAVRQYLWELTTRKNLRWPFNLGPSRFTVLVTTGFLPQRFRDQMRLSWTPEDEIKFNRLLRRLGAFERRLPTMIRVFPFNFLMYDVRRRIRRGRPLV